jgi:transposase
MERKVKYSYEFKLECSELVVIKHYSYESVSKQKLTSESNIRKWVSFYRQYGKAGLLLRKTKLIQLILN